MEALSVAVGLAVLFSISAFAVYVTDPFIWNGTKFEPRETTEEDIEFTTEEGRPKQAVPERKGHQDSDSPAGRED